MEPVCVGVAGAAVVWYAVVPVGAYAVPESTRRAFDVSKNRDDVTNRYTQYKCANPMIDHRNYPECSDSSQRI